MRFKQDQSASFPIGVSPSEANGATLAQPSDTPSSAGQLGALWRQFLPLSLSDVTMALGDPLMTTTLAHMPDTRANLAATGVARSLAIFFESPIIMILHTSNAMAPAAAARRALWRFVVIAIAVLTSLILLLSTPVLFEAVGGRLLGVPAALVERSRYVLLLLCLWPASIGWRRYFQGLLIHNGHSKAVGRAGIGRLISVATTLAVGYSLGMPGATLAGTSLIVGVLTEALLVTVAARRLGATTPPPEEHVGELPTDLKGIWRFYWPLASSMMVVWGGRAVLIALVARSLDAAVALAAWPAAWGMVSLIANATRMVQQVIIRNQEQVERRLLLQFAATVGLCCASFLLLVGSTPPGAWLLQTFIGPNPDLFEAVRPIILLCAPIPLLVAMQNAVQGFLIGAGRTTQVNAATWLGTTTLLGGTVAGLALRLPGGTAAAGAMVISLTLETLWLAQGIWREA